MEKLLKRMRDLREDNDLLQSEIAEKLGITQQQYHLYESGKRTLPLPLLVKLCDFYGVTADYLLGRTK